MTFTEECMAQKDGYITDIEYVHGVYRELGPSALNLVLLIQSLEPVPLETGFTYCDLGCGQGDSLNLFAACHPEGVFHGIDFNPAHVAGATGLAAEAALENVTFWEASFADLDRLPLPQFDFVVMHGIYSWVGAENRQRILAFLRQKLKPGGAVFVSYNCLPGWSGHAPLREFLSAYAETLTGPLEERVEQAIAFARGLREAGAALFTANPATGDFFDYICTLPRNYVAHEFFNRFWTLFYHADVARDFSQAELSFAGAANLAENQDLLRFSPAQMQILQGAPGAVMRETLKDFVAGPLMRRDIFIRQPTRIAPSRQLTHFGSLRFALVLPPAQFEHKALFPIGEVTLEAELYDPIVSALASQPQSLEELLSREELRRFGMGRVTEALMVLLSAQYVMPSVQPSAAAVQATRRWNRVQLERRMHDPGQQPLASPLLRNALKLEWFERLLVICELDEDPDPLGFVWEQMEARGQQPPASGSTATSPDEQLAQLVEQMRAFRQNRLPLLRLLGIV